ncbi:hypothetical protein JCM9157_3287 [Halalkalibacter akibai JCM 9157]|uniref:Uncharacterized protein n=1 Tax=Halalkalibacter akibai (strain ATCC 43226 / DSM 21942 / CIP 109018 / JCM 9157 / 1139) TaxID=1236973 RepID=W4QXS9_HALA3|nr:hypothetical protein JCM9157_3287 [Halalkalibacter akibai JCM 9157]
MDYFLYSLVPNLLQPSLSSLQSFYNFLAHKTYHHTNSIYFDGDLPPALRFTLVIISNLYTRGICSNLSKIKRLFIQLYSNWTRSFTHLTLAIIRNCYYFFSTVSNSKHFSIDGQSREIQINKKYSIEINRLLFKTILSSLLEIPVISERSCCFSPKIFSCSLNLFFTFLGDRSGLVFNSQKISLINSIRSSSLCTDPLIKSSKANSSLVFKT